MVNAVSISLGGLTFGVPVLATGKALLGILKDKARSAAH